MSWKAVRKNLRRFTVAALCMGLLLSEGVECGFGTSDAYADSGANGGATKEELLVENSRIADPNTMDTYREALLSKENGSRYAGRVWTDKTVFAYNAAKENSGTGTAGNQISLDMETDGYNGSVGFESDFAHVFSTLASTQRVNEYPQNPIDLVIAFDMSGSMGQDTRYELDKGVNHYTPHLQQSSYMTFESNKERTYSQAEFSLKHGQSKIAINLPNAPYYNVIQYLKKVTEGKTTPDESFKTNYSPTANGTLEGNWSDDNKYRMTSSGGIGKPTIISFVEKNNNNNNTSKGNLMVTATEIRALSEYDENGTEWEYTVTVMGEKREEVIGKKVYDDMSFDENGEAKFTLKHGESKTAVGLPVGLEYTVTETIRNGFTTFTQGETGKISNNYTSVASFVNIPDSTPQTDVNVKNILVVNMAVTDFNSDKDKEWSFTIQFEGKGNGGDFVTDSWIEKKSNGDFVDDFPKDGVPMEDRIQNSRIQKTLDAINTTIDSLMEQNPQNRVAVCAYGANATVLMPLAHWRRNGNADYLSVGGMETLYHPSDLKVVTGENGVNEWRWMNNRDTCYTVEVNAEINENTSSDPGQDKWEPRSFTVSNNIDSDNAKAYPGTSVQEPISLTFTAAAYKETNNKMSERGKVEEYNSGKEELKKAMQNTLRLDADEYVGYFTNTQGGIYLAYKQLANEEDTTFTETLSSNQEVTVARVPATIIMSDGGANFAFNPMGDLSAGGELSNEHNWATPVPDFESYISNFTYKYDKWKDEFGKFSNEYVNDDSGNYNLFDKYYRLYQEYASEKGKYGNIGNEWYNVWLPGKDTLQVNNEETFKGLPSLFNTGADRDSEGTLSSPPRWYHQGVLYSSDNDVTGLSGTTLEVLLTAAYISKVAELHYQNGWKKKNASISSQLESDNILSTYTMNVDTEHVPLWGKMRIYPTLNPKDYPLDELSTWYQDESKFGTDESIRKALDDDYNNDAVKNAITKDVLFIKASSMDSLSESWENIKKGDEANGVMKIAPNNGNPIAIKIKPIPEDYVYEVPYPADEKISVTTEDVIGNIAYNDGFFDVTSNELDDTFKDILSLITGKVFNPVSGSNAAGASTSVTYQDPIGDYMEIKNQAIKPETESSGSGALSDTYDMSLLHFGEMHGLVRTAVYDFQWNDQWMKAHGKNAGSEEFPKGWYKGSAQEAETTLSGDNGGPQGKNYANAEAAWADDWVYRIGYKDLLDYVPISDADADAIPENLPEQIKRTTYTIYRFTDSEEEREKLRMNPVYGDKVPEDLEKKWAEASPEEKRDDSIYRDTPGVYRLNDIRVWVEEYGDYVDTTGAITPNPSAYDASLYMDIPSAAIPTQKAEITLGKESVLSYQTNVGADLDPKTDSEHYEEYCKQSTPLRLFYAVGLDDKLIIRDEKNQQESIDISALSEEYVSTHRDADNNIYFISNYYSNTPYEGYTESSEPLTRGDPAVTFSPSKDNCYYVFQKPRPLYAHAYRVCADGSLRAVDDSSAGLNSDPWTGNYKAGNGSSKWENSDSNGTGGSSWTGGYFAGVYNDFKSFKNAYGEQLGDKKERVQITDDDGVIYTLPKGSRLEDCVVFLRDDLLKHVTLNSDGSYTDGSISFRSVDYFFLLLDYYMPTEDPGFDQYGNEVDGATGAIPVQRVVTRRGSEFGSGLSSEKITNGDMLCWTDLNGHITELHYNSYTETGDRTRGEPTYEKLFETNGNTLRTYLQENCGIDPNKTIPDPENPEQTLYVLDKEVEYWLQMQKEFSDEINAAKGATGETGGPVTNRESFENYFHFAVAAKSGGLRVGDMYQNRKNKRSNRTNTADTYYVPTIDKESGIGEGTIIDNYLGNNGRLAISNQELLVTKTVVPLDAELTDDQKKEEFNYQVYIEGVTGPKQATVVEYNEKAEAWQRRIGTIDVLTDNSGLLTYEDGGRVVIYKQGEKENIMLVEVTDDKGGSVYYKVKEDGTREKFGEGEPDPEKLYYVYLPPNESDPAGDTAIGANSRRIWSAEMATASNANSVSGRTTYVKEGDPDGERTDVSDNNGFAYENKDQYHPAGSQTYWVKNAELILRSEVQEAEKQPDQKWEHEGDTSNDSHKKIERLELLTTIPTSETSALEFISPFNVKTNYKTETLIFGKHRDEPEDDEYAIHKGQSTANALTERDLYDPVIPKSDRKDFEGLNGGQIAANTAEFTLKHHEGLLFTGLQDGKKYRFTEKLTYDQMNGKNYTLDNVRHVQQFGSSNTYKPGMNNFKDLGDTTNVTGGSVNPDGEPFYHTNALLWESYATFKGDSDNENLKINGNHHEPASTPSSNGSANPNCTESGVDKTLENETVRHYFVKDGELVDKHYSGEESVFGKNRYVVGATAHFGVKDELENYASSELPAKKLKGQYTGVYSVFGDTGNFEEQAHFTNVISLGGLMLTKAVTGEDVDKDKYWTFYIEIHTPSNASAQEIGPCYAELWEYEMPATDAEIDDFIKAQGQENGNDSYIIWEEESDTIRVKFKKADGVDPPPVATPSNAFDWQQSVITRVRLKHGQTLKIFGLPVGALYRVTEVEANKEGYKTSGTHIFGMIGPDITKTDVKFTNHKKRKEEISPGEDKVVKVGDEITYEITWYNYEKTAADVVITDRLDPGVDFVSASFEKYTLMLDDPPKEEAAADLRISMPEEAAAGESVRFRLRLETADGDPLTGPYDMEIQSVAETGDTALSPDEDRDTGRSDKGGSVPVGTGSNAAAISPVGTGTAGTVNSPGGTGTAGTVNSPDGTGTAETVNSPDGTGTAETVNGPDGTGTAETVNGPDGAGSSKDGVPGGFGAAVRGVVRHIAEFFAKEKPVSPETGSEEKDTANRVDGTAPETAENPEDAREAEKAETPRAVRYGKWTAENDEISMEPGTTVIVKGLPIGTRYTLLHDGAKVMEGKADADGKEASFNVLLENILQEPANGNVSAGTEGRPPEKETTRTASPEESITESESPEDSTVESESAEESAVESDSAEDSTVESESQEEMPAESASSEGLTESESQEETSESGKGPAGSESLEESTESVSPEGPAESVSPQEPMESASSQEPTESAPVQESTESVFPEGPTESNSPEKLTESAPMQAPAESVSPQGPPESVSSRESAESASSQKPTESAPVQESTESVFPEGPAESGFWEDTEKSLTEAAATEGSVPAKARPVSGSAPVLRYMAAGKIMAMRMTGTMVSSPEEMAVGRPGAAEIPAERLAETSEETSAETSAKTQNSESAAETVPVPGTLPGGDVKIDIGTAPGTGTGASAGKETENPSTTTDANAEKETGSSVTIQEGVEKVEKEVLELTLTVSSILSDITSTGQDAASQIDLPAGEIAGSSAPEEKDVISSKEFNDGKGNIIIQYDKESHTVKWTLENRPAGDSGRVRLVVRVNKNADKFWSYDNPKAEPSEEEYDNMVRNKASIKVGNNPEQYTNEVDNPTTGGLSITKTVTGSAGDKEKLWVFDIQIDNIPIGFYRAELWENGERSDFTGRQGDLVFENGITHVTFWSGNVKITSPPNADHDIFADHGVYIVETGKVRVWLKHGQTLIISGLPAGVSYRVTEEEADQDGYTTSSTGAMGTIPYGMAEAEFVNSRYETETPPETEPHTPHETPYETPPETSPETWYETTPETAQETLPAERETVPPALKRLPDEEEAPYTGDSHHPFFWLAVMALAMAAAGFSIWQIRKIAQSEKRPGRSRKRRRRW